MNIQRPILNNQGQRGAWPAALAALGAALALASSVWGQPAGGLEPAPLAEPALQAVGMVQLVLLALLAAAVFYVANWTFLDVRRVQTNERAWSAAVLGGGLAALAAALAVPAFAIGFGVGVILFGGTALAYAVHRNALVVPALTVLSRAHLARLRRRLGGRSAVEATHEGPVTAAGRNIIFMGMDDLPLRVEVGPDADPQAAREVERIFFDAITQQAAVVGLLVRPQKAQVRLRVAGKVVEGGDVDGPLAPLVSAAIKRLAGLDPAETRKPQEGRLRAVVAGQTFELRLKTQGSVKGEQIAARVIDLAASRMSLADLGLSEAQAAMVTEALGRRPGIVLVSAPKNSGLTTTLHACLRHIDRYMNTVVAFEPHVDLEVENVQHVALAQEDEAEAERQVRDALAKGADVVMVDSLSSASAAEVLAEAARERTVLVSLRAGDAGQALARLAALVGPDALAQGLYLVMNQRLVRDLCPECKEPYRPNPEFLRKANLATQRVDTLYRPPKKVEFEKGKPVVCSRCNNSRYAGRTGLFELMPLDDEARAMIGRGADAADLRAYARKLGMKNLQEEGLALVIAGRTSIEEVLRAVKQT
jgi:type II secretory ATPase GspE/PulE/Tfp pilus assembly ATPase PilB-like protein